MCKFALRKPQVVGCDVKSHGVGTALYGVEMRIFVVRDDVVSRRGAHVAPKILQGSSRCARGVLAPLVFFSVAAMATWSAACAVASCTAASYAALTKPS